MPRKPNKWEMNPVRLESLLRLLDNDRGKAALRYNRLHSRLVEYALRNSRCDPEELADTVMNRLAGKHAEAPISSSEIEQVAHGIAKKVVQEENRKLLKRLFPPREGNVENWFESLRRRWIKPSKHDKQCAEWAIEQLPEQNRKLIQDYYPHEIPDEEDGQPELRDEHRKLLAKHRNRLAQQEGISEEALRQRVVQIIRRLNRSYKDCQEKKSWTVTNRIA